MRFTRLLASTAIAGAALSVAAGTGAAHAATAPPMASNHHRLVADGHGMGLNVSRARAMRHTSMGHALRVRHVSTTPASYSLQQYAETPGDQGQVGSCVAWATVHSAYGLLMNEQGISGEPMAPMYIYSQIAQGNDQGTTASVALPMEEQQGTDTAADYYQGDFDYTTQPTDAERANAANYKLSGFQDLTSGDVQANVENAISSGLPVVIGMQVRSSFEDLNSSNYNYDPSPSEGVLGGHEITIVGYDSNGVTVENSWGTSWGNNGYFTMPWSVVLGSDVMELHSVGKLVHS